jgi:hypothetical protein
MVQSYQVLEVALARAASGITGVTVRAANGSKQLYSLQGAVQLIKCGDQLYTVDDDGSQTPVYIVSGPQRGTFIRTAPNRSTSDNLLSLKRYRKQ